MFWNKYPYTDFHELNLDIILGMIKELHADWDEFTAVNKITNAGAWDITKQYQAWTIVSDNNIGYISLQPVPAGIAITNNEYWGVIADYDVLITDLSDRVTDCENDIDACEHRLDDCENDIDACENRLDDCEDRLDALENKRYIFISDSYGVLGWCSEVVSRLGLTAAIINEGGAGFYQAGVNGNFLTCLQTYVATLSDEDKLKITDIIVGGGVNDSAQSEATTGPKITEFSTWCAANLPNAKIGVACISWLKRGVDITYYVNRVIPVYAKYSQMYANMYYIPDAYLPMHNNDNMDADGVHPNANGTAAIADFICNYLLGKEVDYVVNNSPTLTAVNCTGTFTMNNKMSKDGVDITFSGGTITFTTPKQFDSFASGITPFADITGGCVQGMVDLDMDVTTIPSIMIPVACTIITSDHLRQYSALAMVSIRNGQICISGMIQDTLAVNPNAYVTSDIVILSPFTAHVGLLES